MRGVGLGKAYFTWYMQKRQGSITPAQAFWVIRYLYQARTDRQVAETGHG